MMEVIRHNRKSTSPSVRLCPLANKSADISSLGIAPRLSPTGTLFTTANCSLATSNVAISSLGFRMPSDDSDALVISSDPLHVCFRLSCR